VLGPPRDERYIRKSRPSKAGRETYTDDAALTLTASLFAALGATPIAGAAPVNGSIVEPFDKLYQRALASDPGSFLNRYYLESDQWRQIGSDWLGAMSDLALALDNDTNNTSLVLAIELPGGDVLLFAADAQVGNWMSWQNVTFRKRPGSKKPVTVDRLL